MKNRLENSIILRRLRGSRTEPVYRIILIMNRYVRPQYPLCTARDSASVGIRPARAPNSTACRKKLNHIIYVDLPRYMRAGIARSVCSDRRRGRRDFANEATHILPLSFVSFQYSNIFFVKVKRNGGHKNADFLSYNVEKARICSGITQD